MHILAISIGLFLLLGATLPGRMMIAVICHAMYITFIQRAISMHVNEPAHLPISQKTARLASIRMNIDGASRIVDTYTYLRNSPRIADLIRRLHNRKKP